MQKTIIVVPTYNEKENLPRLVEALFALQVDGLEILIVDDNSPDGTGDIAETLRDTYQQRVHILHRTIKNGLGPAYIAGFKQAIELGADYIIQMDADFSHQPHYVPQLLAKLETHDLVLGSRFVDGGSVDDKWSFYRKLLSWWANRIYTPTILGMPIYDATGGFKAWRVNTLIGMDIDRVQSNGYVFQVEMNYVAYKLGYRLTEVPIHFPDRQIGTSKMDSSVALEAAMRVWDLLFRYRSLNPSMRTTPEESILAP
ncbi:MAG: polyprenol monophosphomannose synthase [Chloroflexota bacterium]